MVTSNKRFYFMGDSFVFEKSGQNLNLGHLALNGLNFELRPKRRKFSLIWVRKALIVLISLSTTFFLCST